MKPLIFFLPLLIFQNNNAPINFKSDIKTAIVYVNKMLGIKQVTFCSNLYGYDLSYLVGEGLAAEIDFLNQSEMERLYKLIKQKSPETLKNIYNSTMLRGTAIKGINYIAINYRVYVKLPRKYKISLLAHEILHLLGFDHVDSQTVMYRSVEGSSMELDLYQKNQWFNRLKFLIRNKSFVRKYNANQRAIIEIAEVLCLN